VEAPFAYIAARLAIEVPGFMDIRYGALSGHRDVMASA
jgi:hypothetical protein